MLARLIVVILFFVSSFVAAQGIRPASTSTITLIAEDDFFPYTGIKDGKVAGLGVDIITSAFASVGVTVHYRSSIFIRCMKQVKDGADLGCFNSGHEAGMESDYIFHQVPIYQTDIGVFSMTPRPVNVPFRPEDLIGSTVGVTNGYTYDDFLDRTPGIQQEMAYTDLSNLKKLVAKRQEYSLINPRVAAYLFRRFPSEFKNRPALIGIFRSVNTFVAFSRKRSDAQRYADLLDEGLRIIIANGDYRKIENEWNSMHLIFDQQSKPRK